MAPAWAAAGLLLAASGPAAGRPASALEPKRVAEYEANILSVMKEVEYSEKHGNRLDVVLFVNGLPSRRWRQRTT